MSEVFTSEYDEVVSALNVLQRGCRILGVTEARQLLNTFVEEAYELLGDSIDKADAWDAVSAKNETIAHLKTLLTALLMTYQGLREKTANSSVTIADFVAVDKVHATVLEAARKLYPGFFTHTQTPKAFGFETSPSPFNLTFKGPAEA